MPDDATPTTVEIRRRGQKLKVPGVRYRNAAGKMVAVPLTEDGKRIRCPSTLWYGRVKGGKPVALSTDKGSAESKLADLVRDAERAGAGLVDPFRQHRKRPLAGELVEYRRDLTTAGGNPRRINALIRRLGNVFTACNFKTLGDINGDTVDEWLAARKVEAPPPIDVADLPGGWKLAEVARLLGIKPVSVAPMVIRHDLAASGNGKARRFPTATVQALVDMRPVGLAAETFNNFVAQLKAFGKWAALKKGRLPTNPLARLQGTVPDDDRRHARRDLTADEIRRLLEAARTSKRTIDGLDGPARQALYATALGTGFRASALAGLTPECFELGGTPPVIVLPLKRDKSRRGKVQPVSAEVALLLQKYIAGKPAGKPVWPDGWARNRSAADMLRTDLKAAGIPYTAAGPNGPEHADFHALRHSYLTLLGRSGVDLLTAAELAGHVNPQTTKRYMHIRLHDLAGAVGKMPTLITTPLTPPLAMTGTDGPCCTNVAQPSGAGRGSSGLSGAEEQNRPAGSQGRKSLESKASGVKRGCGDIERGEVGKGGSAGDGDLVVVAVTDPKPNPDKGVAPGDSAALPIRCSDISPELARIVEAWPSLPLHIRVSIKTLVDAAARG